jgi:hypothetical protein
VLAALGIETAAGGPPAAEPRPQTLQGADA